MYSTANTEQRQDHTLMAHGVRPDQVSSCNKPKDKKTCSYNCKGIVAKGERFVAGYTPTVQAFKKEKKNQQKQQQNLLSE